MSFYVYILTNKSNTLYIGATDNLKRRLTEHKRKKKALGFTAKYNINKLIYFTEFSSLVEAKQIESKIKGWTRKKKMELIKKLNPTFEDLSSGI